MQSVLTAYTEGFVYSIGYVAILTQRFYPATSKFLSSTSLDGCVLYSQLSDSNEYNNDSYPTSRIIRPLKTDMENMQRRREKDGKFVLLAFSILTSINSVLHKNSYSSWLPDDKLH
jgi:hypothetical protein